MRSVWTNSLMAILACAAVPLAAQAPASTIQQQFEAAEAAMNAEQWDTALATLGALEAKLTNPASLGIVRLRKGEVLSALGRADEAEAALRLGLPAVDARNPALAEDVFRANFTLGTLSERALDHATAIAHFRTAEGLAVPDAWHLRALSALARAGAVIDAATALRDADAALALAAKMGADQQTIGTLENLKGRALLNAGRFKEAQAVLLAAVKKHGGLTLKVDVYDLASRSDLAIAALLAGDKDEGRRYMAYTGAGKLPDGFMTGAEMVPPSCSDTGLSPQDVAVVQFAVNPDGSVQAPATIYSSRQGEAALEFARAAARWSWTPEQVAKIPPLFRAMTRIEMRCSTASERPSVMGLLKNEFDAWVADRQLGAVDDERADAVVVEPARAELARREAAYGQADPRLLPLLVALARNALVPYEETGGLYTRALGIARAEEAPPTVIAFLAANQKMFEVVKRRRRSAQALMLAPLLADPVIASDPRAKAALLLLQADQLTAMKKNGEAQALLDQAVAIDGLPPLDPFRVGALIRLAGLEYASGDIAAARAAYEQTGLTEQQCALADARPVIRGGMPGSNAFPMDAMRWGFEGWAVPEFDVSAKGDSLNMRTTIAYPPFIFGKASEEAVDKMSFSQSYRPEGSLGCGGLRLPIAFRLP